MSTPENPAPGPTETPSSAPPGPPNPDFEGLDFLNQAFNKAGDLKQPQLAGLIGAGIQAMRGAIIDKATQQASLDAANKKWLQLDARAKQQDTEIDKLRTELVDSLAVALEREVVIADLRAKYEPAPPVEEPAPPAPEPVETPFVPAAAESPPAG
jgi:hypothetical protein